MAAAHEVFGGCIPALMTPCRADRTPDHDALVRRARELVDLGMSAVIYCGSMGDWPLLTDAERQEGVARLAAAGLPVIVGTGAVSTRAAAAHAAHAAEAGAVGLMVIPRLLSRGTSAAAQRAHFAAVLSAAPRPAGGDLQQPLLRLFHPRGPLLRACAQRTRTSSASRSSAARRT